MGKKRSKVYAPGQTLTAYINNTVDDEMLEWLNKQTDVTGLIFLGLLNLYKQTGNIDVVDYIPRRYSSDVPLPVFPANTQDANTSFSDTKTELKVITENNINNLQRHIANTPIAAAEKHETLDDEINNNKIGALIEEKEVGLEVTSSPSTVTTPLPDDDKEEEEGSAWGNISDIKIDDI